MSRSFEDYQHDKREREWNEKVKKQKEGMNNAERVKRATQWKSIGNDKFKSGNVWEAREYYREAIIYVEDLVDARRKERNDLLMPLYTNLAQVHLKVDEHKEAEDVCTKALNLADIAKNNIGNALKAKAQFRRGVARKGQGKLEEAKEDLVAAHKLQPENEEVSRELTEVRETLAGQEKQAKAVMGGFLNKAADERQQKEAKKIAQAEARILAEEKRNERRARAEQKQQMQQAFKKLAEGEMLYEQREKEMGPIREKEKEKEQTLDLEKNLRNIIDESKGLEKSKDLEAFKEKRLEEAKGQSKELDQKKKVLDKVKKEEQWDVDDQWKGQREDHRKQLDERRQNGEIDHGPNSMWESKEVARWCEQRLRDTLVPTIVEGAEVEPDVARLVVGKEKVGTGTGYILKALVTDVLKLTGDASVMRLNSHKPPLHYYDYFIKLDWEVAVERPGQRSYRSGEELIMVAAKKDDGKAPASVAENRVLAGTFKIREFCFEDEPKDGNMWELTVKVKKRCEVPELSTLADEVRDRLKDKVSRHLLRWAKEFREHWS